MSIIVVGTNHKICPIEIREKLYFPKKRLSTALRILSGIEGINSGVILSTCNRVELYADAKDPDLGIQALKEFLANYQEQELAKIEPYLYQYIGKEAVGHLFRVACGLDSQIIGENQILEQVSFAYGQAKAIEATNRLLDLIFETTIKTSLRIKRDTRISSGDISMATIACELIKAKYSTIKDKNVLIIGVSKISELVIAYLKQEEAKTVFIANRTFKKAQDLAENINAQVVRFERLKEKLSDADIIISATASPHLVLKKEDLLGVKKPLLIIDLAVPRDIDPRIKEIKGVSLFDLDDLDFVVEKNLEKRKQEIPQALDIIEKETESLCLIENLKSEPEPVLLL